MRAGNDRVSIFDVRAAALDGVTGMSDLPPILRRPGWLCLGYGMLMLYASTVIGPLGLHFVAIDPALALQRFLAVHFVNTGSDQRADWIGNLLMLVPFGFLVAGTVWPGRTRLPYGGTPSLALRFFAAMGALLICVATVLTIKYLQLFFPPRTVTLNYIVAQCAGALLGIAGFAWIGGRLGLALDRRDPVVGLVLVLRLYVLVLTIFVLMPLDFALNATDLWGQVERLPNTFVAIPGLGRPLAVRTVLMVMASAAFVPVGMLLAFVKTGLYRVRRRPAAVIALALGLATGLYLLSTLVMGAAPALVSIPLRAFGMVAGAMALRWLVRQDMARLRVRLRGWVTWMIPVYVLVVLVVNQLLSVHWLSVSAAVSRVYVLGLLPLFDYYIVSKASAAKNIVGHAVLYMPIGVALWLRGRGDVGRQAFVLAALVSLVVGLGRYLRPGLEGDINAVAVAGLSALLTARLMPGVWSMLEKLAERSVSTPVRQWNKRQERPIGEVLGDTEHY
jgi:glycopeptide antibiotics resistance protein